MQNDMKSTFISVTHQLSFLYVWHVIYVSTTCVQQYFITTACQTSLLLVMTVVMIWIKISSLLTRTFFYMISILSHILLYMWDCHLFIVPSLINVLHMSHIQTNLLPPAFCWWNFVFFHDVAKLLYSIIFKKLLHQ